MLGGGASYNYSAIDNVWTCVAYVGSSYFKSSGSLDIAARAYCYDQGALFRFFSLLRVASPSFEIEKEISVTLCDISHVFYFGGFTFFKLRAPNSFDVTILSPNFFF